MQEEDSCNPQFLDVVELHFVFCSYMRKKNNIYILFFYMYIIPEGQQQQQVTKPHNRPTMGFSHSVLAKALVLVPERKWNLSHRDSNAIWKMGDF